MKKTFIAILVGLITFGAMPAKAQLDFGIVAGMNLSKASFNNDFGRNFRSDNRCGYFVGPKVEFTVPVIGIGADISAQYSQRYVEGESVDAMGSHTSTKTLKTIEIPVNLRYQFGMQSVIAGYIATGPQFGFNVGSGRISNWWSADEYKVKNSILTWNIGAGIKVLKHLEVGVGYNIALTKFAKVTGTRESIKTSSFQAHVGYFF